MRARAWVLGAAILACSSPARPRSIDEARTSEPIVERPSCPAYCSEPTALERADPTACGDPDIAVSPDDPDHAVFREGRDAYQDGRYDDAIRLWEGVYARAHARTPRTSMLYNLAQAYERVGRYDDAVRSWAQLLVCIPEDDPRRRLARARIHECRVECTRCRR